MKVLVTGADGFVGRHVFDALKRAGHEVVTTPKSLVDLMDASATAARVAYAEPDAVIHLAGLVGGIGANQARPADFWRHNLQMGINILEACRLATVRRLV